MQNPSHGIDVLVAAVGEYAPNRVGTDCVHLQGLKLYVDIREIQSMDAGDISLFISEVNASANPGQPGINVTCVGMGDAMPKAVADAVAQWVLGVLPVLAHWRGHHACLSSPVMIETSRGTFDVLGGPIIGRGQSEDHVPTSEDFEGLWKLMQNDLVAMKLAPRTHWLELYACQTGDGSVEATCRLDNRDWDVGQQRLADDAASWPPSDEPLRSRRQFTMLLSKSGGDPQAIVVPSFWARLFGRG